MVRNTLFQGGKGLKSLLLGNFPFLIAALNTLIIMFFLLFQLGIQNLFSCK